MTLSFWVQSPAGLFVSKSAISLAKVAKRSGPVSIASLMSRTALPAADPSSFYPLTDQTETLCFLLFSEQWLKDAASQLSDSLVHRS